MIQLMEEYDLAEKKKWQTRFFRDYPYETRISDGIYGANVRFFVGIENNLKLGFIRLNEKTSVVKRKYGYVGPVWNIADTYVKKEFRSRGVQRQMFELAVSEYGANMLNIHRNMLFRDTSYYRDVGFTHFVVASNGELCWCFTSDLASFIKGATVL